MRKTFTLAMLLIAFAFQVPAQNVVVPLVYDSTTGTSSFLGPLANAQRTYQLLINQSQLTALVGRNITGISFRNPASSTNTWPAADVSYSSYDIYMSNSVTPANRSLTFQANVVGLQRQVRSGSLVIRDNTYPFGSSPNQFGPEISFTSPWSYTGGHVLIEIRHTGFSGTSRSIDAVGTSIAGYGTLFSACWTGNYAGVEGTQGNFSVVRLGSTGVFPISLLSFNGQLRNGDAELVWKTSSEAGSDRFEVEKSKDGRIFSAILSVPAAGRSTSEASYACTDKNAAAAYGTNLYYRLKMIDKDGSFSYSKLLTLKKNPVEPIYSVYPNPVKTQFTLAVSSAQAEKVTYSLTNAEGKRLFTKTWLVPAGKNNTVIDMKPFAAGTYILSINGLSLRKEIHVVKQ